MPARHRAPHGQAAAHAKRRVEQPEAARPRGSRFLVFAAGLVILCVTAVLLVGTARVGPGAIHDSSGSGGDRDSDGGGNSGSSNSGTGGTGGSGDGAPQSADSVPPSWLSSAPRPSRGSVVHVFDHDPKAFTQGLFVHDGNLYESTGLYGESTVRRVDLATGTVFAQTRLRSNLFGEVSEVEWLCCSALNASQAPRAHGRRSVGFSCVLDSYLNAFDVVSITSPRCHRPVADSAHTFPPPPSLLPPGCCADTGLRCVGRFPRYADMARGCLSRV
jgi:hypothetical protein